VDGEVDLASAEHLRAAVLTALAEHDTLTLDLSRAMFFDAAGLRVLHAAHREAARLGKPAPILRGVRPLLARSLQITKMRTLFTLEPPPPPARALTTASATSVRAPGRT
jgi:anti-anti-sigma factor